MLYKVLCIVNRQPVAILTQSKNTRCYDCPVIDQSSPTATLSTLQIPCRQYHAVQFYQSEHSLLAELTTFIGSGLQSDDACLIIATPSHLAKLEAALVQEGFYVPALRAGGMYQTYDASTILAACLTDGIPDEYRFQQTIGHLLNRATGAGRRVRIYGETVSLLWREGNKEHVMRLEQFWNRLAQRQPFSLFCAYPQLHFVMHPDVVDAICRYHDRAAGSISLES